MDKSASRAATRASFDASNVDVDRHTFGSSNGPSNFSLFGRLICPDLVGSEAIVCFLAFDVLAQDVEYDSVSCGVPASKCGINTGQCLAKARD